MRNLWIFWMLMMTYCSSRFLFNSVSCEKTHFINNNHNNNNNNQINDNKCLIMKKTSISNYSHLASVNGVKLEFGKSFLATVKRNQTRRFTIFLNESSPLAVQFTGHLADFENILFYNKSVIRHNTKEFFLPCAVRGVYDLAVIANTTRQKSRIRIDVSNRHPHSDWPLLNRNSPVRLRAHIRIQKQQMILKWSKSQLDVHAINYCLIINTQKPVQNFCSGVVNSHERKPFSQYGGGGGCDDFNLWLRHRERIKEIRSQQINVICTGKKSQQILKGLKANLRYFIDIFGIHTKLKNLPILLKSTSVWFNRTHPNVLKDNQFSVEKISDGTTSISVFSFKVPLNSTASKLRYLILPCGGSKVDVKILQRKKILLEQSVYQPTYIDLMNIYPGGRYLTRIFPSNSDEILKANKVGIAISTSSFHNLPELPENRTVFEIRSARTCNQTTIAWHASPESKPLRYCAIVLKLLRSSNDPTNYCMDFSKKITKHPLFQFMTCIEKSQKAIEDIPLLNLNPHNSYLVYVTVNLLNGNHKNIPYKSLTINYNSKKHCHFKDPTSTSSAFYT